MNNTNIIEFIFIKMNDFYLRLTQLSEHKGFKSVNKFALEGLNYASSEKLNRLKKENSSPSVEILLDITNKFDEINPAWLLTGKGEMLLTSDFLPSSNPIVAKANAVIDAQLVAALQETNVTLKENNAMLKENNATLKKELEACQDEKKILATNKSVV